MGIRLIYAESYLVVRGKRSLEIRQWNALRTDVVSNRVARSRA